MCVYIFGIWCLYFLFRGLTLLLHSVRERIILFYEAGDGIFLRKLKMKIERMHDTFNIPFCAFCSFNKGVNILKVGTMDHSRTVK